MSALSRRRPLRAGVLGYSDISRRKFIPALLKSNRAYLSAIASRRMAKIDPLFSGISIDIVSYHELIADPSIDLVYISLPNSLHEEWTIRALEQGKHVICEKPLGLSTSSVNRMLDAADGNGRLLYENIMYLHHPQHAEVKKIIESGRMGRILSLHTEFAFPGPKPDDFRLDPSMGGGAFHDLNRYPLSAALFFLSDAKHGCIRGVADIREGLVNSFKGESTTGSGESFSFLIAFGQPYRSYYELTTGIGSIRVDRAFTTPYESECRISVSRGGKDESFTVPPCDHFLLSLDHVCRLITEGGWEGEHERTRRLGELSGIFYGAVAGG